MHASITFACSDPSGQLLGQLSIIDRKGRESISDEGEVSLSELSDYVVRFTGQQASNFYFLPPVESLPSTTNEEIIGFLDRPPGLGLIPLEIQNKERKVKWRKVFLVRAEKLGGHGEFERMVGDLCRWRTALTLDLHAHSSAPWTWADNICALTPEERLIVLRASFEDNRIFENIDLIERTALKRLHRDSELILVGEEAIDVFRLGLCLNGPGARIALPITHPLSSRLGSIPTQLPPARKVEIVDTPENQFVKVVIHRFRQEALEALKDLAYYSNSALVSWAKTTERRLNRAANSIFFSEISWPSQMALGSPALHRRPGYRSILQAFLDVRAGFSLPCDQFTSAVYGETRDLPTIYEYWCLLRLREALEVEFGAQFDMEHFLVSSGRLTIRRGSRSQSSVPIIINAKQFTIELNYNRNFSPSETGVTNGFCEHDGASVGTWSKTMKPDFTISLRPIDLNEEEAAAKNILRLIHFDAKYRLKKLAAKDEATHIPDDIDKMHAYLAAINHSCGSYILFPGNATELLAAPSSLEAVGAIPLLPGEENTFRANVRNVIQRACIS